jgi:glutathione synthase/RimK-type ligase-like ATP-grasp enzyme
MVKKEDITRNEYGYSLFQENIPKKYELRVFYFVGQIYTMALFSQLDYRAKTDVMAVSINGEKQPLRQIPFNLTREMEENITRLMHRLKLNSGSIDIIVTPDDEYYFLEVNPVGQFNFMSEMCNYYIEREIAKYLAL